MNIDDEIHVRTWGASSDTPIVLVHAGVADSRGWEGVAQRLDAAGSPSVAPDLRGYGASADASSDFRHVEDLQAVIKQAAHGEPVVLVGWSMGGGVATELALLHPSLVRALVLVCSVPFGLPRSEFVQDSWKRESALFEAGDIEGAIRNDIATWGAGPTRTVDDLDPALVEYMTEVARDQLAREDRQRGEALDGEEDALAGIAASDLPVLVLVADLDTPCHQPAADALAASSSTVRVEHVANAAHMAPIEQPDAVASAILRFVGDLA